MTIQQAIAKCNEVPETSYFQSRAHKVRISAKDNSFMRVKQTREKDRYYFGGQYRLSLTEIMAMDYEVFTVDKIEDGKE